MSPRPDAPRFYTPLALSSGATITLDENASRHIAGALRLGPGADIRLFDGQGGEYAARVTAAGKREVTAEIGEFFPAERESPLSVHLGLGISRGERMDYAVQKSTELGVTRITPLVTERTEVRLKGERLERKQLHWQQVAISACEQCGRNRLPVIEPITALADWLANGLADGLAQTQAGCKLVLHHRAPARLAQLPRVDTAALLIGPEGGLSDTEIDAAEQQGFMALALGPRVLRTETAPVAALSILQFHWGDMQ